jgi:cytochrome b involved in lipid metabolism
MAERKVSVAELRLHTKAPWLVVDHIVWDLGDFVQTHPGGAESQISQSQFDSVVNQAV